MARLPQHVTRVDTPNGVRYEARVNGPRDGHRRMQLRKRFTTPAEAAAWHARTSAELSAGTHIEATELTVKQAVDQWLAAKTARVKPTTAAAYTAALAPVIERYGSRRAQRITKQDVETLVTELRTGTPDRRAWARTSINPMLARWKSVWADLHAQGILPRNVVALVEPLRKPAGEAPMKTDDSLTDAEVDTLLAAHSTAATGHARRREPFLHLALMGLRRAEIAGLRWSAIDLDAEEPTLSVRLTRVSTPGGVVEQRSAKTASSARTLPLPPHLIPILRRVRLEQKQMRLRAANLWEGGRDGHVVATELGRALSPRTLNRWWQQALIHAGLPHRRLHASRHTAASLLNSRGAPVTMIAAWLGHGDGGNLAMRTYVHVRDSALSEAAKLLGKD